jgi:hypothetical protein
MSPQCPRSLLDAVSAGCFALGVLIAIAPPVQAGSKVLATGTETPSEATGCTKVEGFVVDGADGLIVTTADCGGTPRGWLSMPPPPGRDVSPTDSSLVLDRFGAGKLGTGQLFSSGPYCSVGGKELQWVAVYEWRKRKTIDFRNGGIRQAWVVDSATRRFVPAPKPLLEKARCHAGDDE